MTPKFQVYHEGEPWDGTKGYRWRLVSANGVAIADSRRAYSSRGNAIRACRRLMTTMGSDDHHLWIEVLDD